MTVYFHTDHIIQQAGHYYEDCGRNIITGGKKNMNENKDNTPGTAGGPGGRDRTLAVAKNRAKMTFFLGGKKITPKKYFFFAYIF